MKKSLKMSVMVALLALTTSLMAHNVSAETYKFTAVTKKSIGPVGARKDVGGVSKLQPSINIVNGSLPASKFRLNDSYKSDAGVLDISWGAATLTPSTGLAQSKHLRAIVPITITQTVVGKNLKLIKRTLQYQAEIGVFLGYANAPAVVNAAIKPFAYVNTTLSEFAGRPAMEYILYMEK